jgi:hypothetical protein
MLRIRLLLTEQSDGFFFSPIDSQKLCPSPVQYAAFCSHSRAFATNRKGSILFDKPKHMSDRKERLVEPFQSTFEKFDTTFQKK